MIFNIIQRKPESQEEKKLLVHSSQSIAKKTLLVFISFLLITTNYQLPTALAIVDPLASPNNKFGIHIISASTDETAPAANLINSNGGDWGYVTVLVESRDRNHDKWQEFFNNLRHRHIIPLVRLATQPEGSFWKRPYEGEEEAWAGFLDNLVWPTKNRYIIIYNEPNQGQEWAGQVDAASYAQVLDKTITALKNKNPDFFVLNAGFDASAPNKPPLFADEWEYLKQMNNAVPGIFNKLDGWVSHSYPNPGFAGSPKDTGRGTVATWYWELQKLRELGVTKNLPVFITETGWKHAEGIDYDKSLPSAETVGDYFIEAFNNAWSSDRIIAITPFLLDYQAPPFDHFSFKKITGEEQNFKILGASFPDYYPHYQSLLDMPKSAGKPEQDNKSQLTKGSIYTSIVSGEDYMIPLTFKNTGQSIWNGAGPITLKAVQGEKELGIEPIQLLPQEKIEPGQEATFNVHLKAPQSGHFPVSLQLFTGNKAFDQDPLVFQTQVKSPVILLINAVLVWKENPAGEYVLNITSDIIKNMVKINLDENGKSQEIEARFLPPDQNFAFTLYKPYYQPKTIQVNVQSGFNTLNFGTLEPDLFSAILKPGEFWKLLPFSN